MKGHIRKVVERRELRRSRRRRSIQHPKPRAVFLQKIIFVKKTYSTANAILNRKTLYYNNLMYLTHYTTLFRNTLKPVYNLFTYKLLYDVYVYYMYRSITMAKNAFSINTKWSTTKSGIRTGKETNEMLNWKYQQDFIYRTAIFSKFFFKLLFKNNNQFRYNILFYNKLLLMRNTSHIFLYTYARLQNFLLNNTKSKNFILELAAHQSGNPARRIGMALKQKFINHLHFIDKKRYALTLKNNLNQYTKRILKHKLHNVYIFVYRWSNFIKNSMSVRTQISNLYIDEFTTHGIIDRRFVATCTNNSREALYVEQYKVDYVNYIHTCKHRLATQQFFSTYENLLHDFAYYETATNEQLLFARDFFISERIKASAAAIRKKAKEESNNENPTIDFTKLKIEAESVIDVLNTGAFLEAQHGTYANAIQDITKHKREKNDINMYAHLGIIFFWDFFFEEGQIIDKNIKFIKLFNNSAVSIEYVLILKTILINKYIALYNIY